MVVDTSALVAILTGEPERDLFIDALARADDPLISAGTLLECSIVMAARSGAGGLVDLDDLLGAACVRVVAVDSEQVHVARAAWQRFGRGRDPAGLNFGDLFGYALAITTGRPLLSKGDDFTRTEISPAAP
jgi:ribonuclease VapC